MRGRALLKALLGVLGAALTVALMASAFFRWDLRGEGPLLQARFSWGQFVAQVRHHPSWLLPFALLSAAVIPLRALQWQRTLAKPVPFRERYHLVALGAFVHNALPGKLGDVFRAFLLARTQQLPFVQALGSVAVCKLLEFSALMSLVALSFLGPFAETLRRFSAAMRVATWLLVGLVALVILLARYAGRLAAALRQRGRLARVRGFLENTSAGLGTARSLRGLAVAFLFSLPPVLAPALGYGLGLQAIGARAGIFAGAVVLGAIALGQATPGLPAGTGIYYFVTSWSARSLGASDEQAAVFAALTHLMTISSQVLVGGLSVWRRKLHWRDLRRASARAAEELKESAQPLPGPGRA